ncbi:MAG: hypothetical protein AAF494_13070 [Pseudomonadota bacterium]
MSLLTIALSVLASACVPAEQASAPSAPADTANAGASEASITQPVPAPAQSQPAPPPPPLAEPTYANYLDAPASPGTWRYEDEPGENLALFGATKGQPIFLLRCAEGKFAIGRVTDQPQSSARAMSVTTETGSRQLTAEPVPGRTRILAAYIPPDDELLDAMAITKGRIAIQVEGERTLYVPAWAEISRVIEDCR